MAARLSITFAALFLLLSISSARRPLDFPANDVGDNAVNGLNVVRKGGLPEFLNKANLLLPSEKPESDPSEKAVIDFDNVAGKNVPLPTVETIPGEIEEKEPVNADEIILFGPEIVSAARPEETGEEHDAEERIQNFRSTHPLTIDNIHPNIPFRPINRHRSHFQMRNTFPKSRLPHCFHHHQISVHPFGQEMREGMPDRNYVAAFKKAPFVPIREFPTRLVEFHKVNDEFPVDDRDAMTIGEFKRSFHRGDRDGMMSGEFKGHKHFFHRLRPHHHHHHHFNHGERAEVEENEPERQRAHEERDDGVLMQIRKFLTHF
ncbi:hypothetical protein Nepgr_012706 [Nepenthes gracilis]|uniref:Uncharacterized protein n=1 Tax=Nepenthes gracilis TaxID=150966 RepID=A0AAD3SG91_NEPGR|nr:hypothetical protein Nepgr_012706 [Nepenthes gracilis]